MVWFVFEGGGGISGDFSGYHNLAKPKLVSPSHALIVGTQLLWQKSICFICKAENRLLFAQMFNYPFCYVILYVILILRSMKEFADVFLHQNCLQQQIG